MLYNSADFLSDLDAGFYSVDQIVLDNYCRDSLHPIYKFIDDWDYFIKINDIKKYDKTDEYIDFCKILNDLLTLARKEAYITLFFGNNKEYKFAKKIKNWLESQK